MNDPVLYLHTCCVHVAPHSDALLPVVPVRHPGNASEVVLKRLRRQRCPCEFITAYIRHILVCSCGVLFLCSSANIYVFDIGLCLVTLSNQTVST